MFGKILRIFRNVFLLMVKLKFRIDKLNSKSLTCIDMIINFALNKLLIIIKIFSFLFYLLLISLFFIIFEDYLTK